MNINFSSSGEEDTFNFVEFLSKIFLPISKVDDQFLCVGQYMYPACILFECENLGSLSMRIFVLCQVVHRIFSNKISTVHCYKDYLK